MTLPKQTKPILLHEWNKFIFYTSVQPSVDTPCLCKQLHS